MVSRDMPSHSTWKFVAVLRLSPEMEQALPSCGRQCQSNVIRWDIRLSLSHMLRSETYLHALHSAPDV